MKLVKPQVWSLVWNKIWDDVYYDVRRPVYAQVWDISGDHGGSPVWRHVGDQVRNFIWDQDHVI